MRQGSAPNFCPPVEEGFVLETVDEAGDVARLEFLGLLLHGGRSYCFFSPLGDNDEPDASGELVMLEAIGFDEDGQPDEFELVVDEAIAAEVYEDFKTAAKDLYDFA